MREEDLKKYHLTVEEWTALNQGNFSVIEHKFDPEFYYALAFAFGVEAALSHLSPAGIEKAFILTTEYDLLNKNLFILKNCLRLLPGHTLGIGLCMAASKNHLEIVDAILEEALDHLTLDDLVSALTLCLGHSQDDAVMDLFQFKNERLLLTVFDGALTRAQTPQITYAIISYLQSRYFQPGKKREIFYKNKLAKAAQFSCPNMISILLRYYGKEISRGAILDALMIRIEQRDMPSILAILREGGTQLFPLTSAFLLRILEMATIHAEGKLVVEFLLANYESSFKQHNILHCLFLATQHNQAGTFLALWLFNQSRLNEQDVLFHDTVNQALECAAEKGYSNILIVLFEQCFAYLHPIEMVVAFLDATLKRHSQAVEVFLQKVPSDILSYIVLSHALTLATNNQDPFTIQVLTAAFKKRLYAERNLEAFLFHAAKNNLIVALPILQELGIVFTERALEDALLLAATSGHDNFIATLYQHYQSQFSAETKAIALRIADPNIQQNLQEIFANNSLHFAYPSPKKKEEMKFKLGIDDLLNLRHLPSP